MGLPSGLFPSDFPTKTLYTYFFSPYVLHTPPISFLLYLIIRKIFIDEYKSLSSSIHSFLHSLVTSSLLGPNIFLSTLFSNTLSPRSSLNVNNKVSHPYETRGKVRVLYILIFVFLVSKLERLKILHTMVTSILWLKSPLYFFLNEISICEGYSQIF